MNPVPVADPGANYRRHRQAIDEAVGRVLDSGWYILGEEVRAFERAFAEIAGVSHAIGVANGTDAVELALRACGIGAGDRVATVSHTAVATVVGIERAGAVPVLVDIDETYNVDIEQLSEAVVEHKCRAVVVVHLYGRPVDMDAVASVATAHRLVVVEDCAQAHGATWNGRPVGSFGHAAAFSFYPTKNLGALGDAGIVVTPDPVVADRGRALRQYGWHDRYVSKERGMNSRLDELHAAVLGALLPSMLEDNDRRRGIADAYDAAFVDMPLVLPSRPLDGEHVFHQYVVKAHDRDGLRAALGDHGVGTAVLYPVPVHRQPAYLGSLITHGSLPQTERVVDEILSLPMGPHLDDEDVAQVCAAVRSVLTGAGA